MTPQITAANTVIMRISMENASPDFSRAVNGIPPIDTQRALTQVLVSDGETTVIGGIYVSREQTSQDRTPGLHRLPLLGWLFKRDEFTDESRELPHLHYAPGCRGEVTVTAKLQKLARRPRRLGDVGAVAGCGGEFVRDSQSPVLAGRQPPSEDPTIRTPCCRTSSDGHTPAP